MITKRNSVYWYKFKWSVKNADGTREHFVIRRTTRTASKKDALAMEGGHRRALAMGLVHPRDPWPRPAAPAPIKFREFAAKFKEHVKTHTKPGTMRFYGECLDRLLTHPPVAGADLAAIKGEQVSGYVQRRLHLAKNSVTTINGDLRTLRRMLRLAEEWGLLPRAPRVHELTDDSGRTRVISHQEEAAYLAAASQTLRDATILAADTGLRPDSELFPLEWVNVSLERTPEAANGLLRIPQGKTSNAVRAIPLTPRGREVLLRRSQSKNGAAKNKYVFPGSGNKGHLVTIQHPHERAMKKAGLTAFPFYCWRHTFGTRCAESGMDRFSLARLMGHSSPRVTERYYIHVTESHVANGFEKFVAYQAGKAIVAVADPQASDRRVLDRRVSSHGETPRARHSMRCRAAHR